MSRTLDDFLLETPFLDAELLDRPGEATAGEPMDYQVAPRATSSTFPSGQTLQAIPGPSLVGEEYFDPYSTANPLLDVSGSKASTRVSKSFTAGEFARSGSVKFPKARIDPALVECMEALRAFLKTSVTIIDGYYSYKYFLDLAKRQGVDKSSVTPHLSGQAVKFKAGGLSGLELAKAVVFVCSKDTSVAIGESNAAVYVKQATPQVTSYIKDGEKREKVIHAIRQYRELCFSDSAMVAATTNQLHGIRQFVHGAIHKHQIRDANIIADVAFYKSDYVNDKRTAGRVSGIYDRTKALDRDLRKEIAGIIKPALAELVAPAANTGGVPTTPKGERNLAPAQPDRAPADITGRYETIHKDSSEELGKTICVNQAGTHIEVVMSAVNSPGAVWNAERYTNRYYGDLEAGGAFKLFSRGADLQKRRLVPRGASVEFEWTDGSSTSYETYQRVGDAPVVLEQAAATFEPDTRPLLEAYEWKPLLRKQIDFLRLFFADPDRIGRLLKKFYDAEGNGQRWKESFQAHALREFGEVAIKWVKDPTRGYHASDKVLALFYIRHYLTFNRWRPSSSYPYLPALDWAQRAVSVIEYQCKHHPNRTGTNDPSGLIDDLVDVAGLKKASQSDGHIHTYRVTMKLTGATALAGGMAGTLTVEKTDDKKWPQASETFKIWFVTVGAGFKWKKGKGGTSVGPFKAGETHVGKASSNFYWLPNDFPSQVRVALGEASASAGAKASAEGGFLHILGRGGLPTLEVIFGDVDLGAGGKSVGVAAEIIAGIGKIRDKNFKDVEYPVTPDKSDYAVKYGFVGKAHFGFNGAVLKDDTRMAIRVMCAHELVALMSSDSHLAIEGYTDAVGEPAKNLTLSALRAANTGQALEDILGGKLKCKVDAKGYGEKEAVGETLRNQDRRRVDLKLNGRLVLRLRA